MGAGGPTCWVEVHKVGDGVLVRGEGGSTGGPGGRQTRDRQRVRPFSRLNQSIKTIFMLGLKVPVFG